MKTKMKIVSNFKEKPKFRITWWAMVFGLLAIIAVVLISLEPVVRNAMDTISPLLGNNRVLTRFIVNPAFASIGFTILGMITGISSYKKGERSWILWLGFVPAILASLFWGFFILGEFLFPH